MTVLDKMYDSLSKRRKNAPADLFASVSEPKSKRISTEENKTRTDDHSASIYPLFDVNSPYFLGDVSLEPTDLPLVVSQEFKEPEKRRGKSYPPLPKIPSQIRWDQYWRS